MSLRSRALVLVAAFAALLLIAALLVVRYHPLRSDYSQLELELLVIGLILLIVLFIAVRTLWSLAVLPLRDLQEDLTAVSDGELELVIEAYGPSEIRDVGLAAELMRQRLLAEIDEARAADEALAQRGPLVAALRDELAPSGALASLATVDAAAQLVPAEGVLAGDWVDIVALPDSRVALVVADVAGHGAEAGLAALRIKHTITVGLAEGQSPGLILTRAAATFAHEEERFATAVIVVVDPQTRTFIWANAGHPAPLLFGEDGLALLDPTGPILSRFGGEWDEGSAPIAAGEIVVGFSDGLMESHDVDGNELGVAGIVGSLGRLDIPAMALVGRLVAAARARAVDWRRDDVAIAVLSIVPAPVTNSATGQRSHAPAS